MNVQTVGRILRDVLVVALFAAAALGLAYQLSVRDQRARAEVMASVVLNRTAITTEQLAAAFQRMAVFGPEQACSAEARALMRQVDLSSSMLQGVGYIENDRLLCSSLGEPDVVAVGAPDYVSATDTTFRRDRDLSIAPGFPLLFVSSRTGYTGLVHPSLIFNLMDASLDLDAGVISYSTRERIVSSGLTTWDWSSIDLPADRYSGTMMRDGHLLAWQRSPTWDHFTYAALPMAAVIQQFAALSWVAAPAGIVLGLVALLLCRRLAASWTSLPSLLRAGLRRNEIRTVYQPIVDLRTGRWVGAEALARWKRPTGEWVSPDVFVPIAERHGLIPRLTQNVVAACCADLKVLCAGNEHFFVSINISSADLRQPGFAAALSASCRAHGIAHSSIHLEITERSEVDADAELPMIAALRALGFQVGIDDFGIGYSNLAYLDLLHVDYLKIDRAFVAAISRSGQLGTQVVDHIIDLASERGLTLIAEGIELEEQRAALVSRGVQLGQGWLYAKPMTRDEFAVARSGVLPDAPHHERRLARVA